MEHVRNTYAMAREGRLPAVLATVSKSGTPRAALIVVVVATSLVILSADLLKGELYEVLLNLYAPNIMLIFLILAYGAIRLRNREPGLARPYKMPLYPWPAILTIVANGALLVLFVVSDWRTGLYSLLSLALAFPLYALGRAWWRPSHPG
jgi:APA family basic amino acid/polyamine antiporter